MTEVKTFKKLIEVALPLEAINKAAAHEKMPGIGPHPRGLHLWWARRPLAAARAVIFAQMVDDPSAHPDLFPDEKAQDKERKRLFRILEQLVTWENTTNEAVLQQARDEIWQSWRRTCAANAGHPRAAELFDRNKLPGFHDPFAGGGALPLEAQRLGLESYASDLNPVAVLINKAMIEIPPKFAGREPVNPEWQKKSDAEKAMTVWRGAQGLAEDVRYYGKWMRDEAEKRIGHLYPKVEVSAEMARERPDLQKYVGQKLTVIAWIWARTVKSPNPAFANVDVPLASTFMLSTKAGNEAYVEPVIEGKAYRFAVRVGKPPHPEATKIGTKLARANFKCLMSGAPISGDYIKSQGIAGNLSVRLMAVVVEGIRGRVYINPDDNQEAIAASVEPDWFPPVQISGSTQYIGVRNYGMESFGQTFTARQLNALNCFSSLLEDAYEKAIMDCDNAGLIDGKSLREGGSSKIAYAEAIKIILAFAVNRVADFSNSLCGWSPTNQKVMHLFGKQSLPMVWDFAEANCLEEVVGGFVPASNFISDCLKKLPARGIGSAFQDDARLSSAAINRVVSTDPPYYDNVPYSDLSDFFYLWLRRNLRDVYPQLFATVAAPKQDELVAFAYRHDGVKARAERFFLDGMSDVFSVISKNAHPSFPITIYYAFKQSETDDVSGTSSTGWETFLGAVSAAGLAVTGTWPMRSEQEFRMRGMGSNALASSIVLVCRPRDSDAPSVNRRDFLNALNNELPQALTHLQAGNIAPVDLAQASIGPGMEIFTRYARVLDSDGKPLTVRTALALINQVLDESLMEQEGDFDSYTRWAVAWFDQVGFSEGPFGRADDLARAKATAVEGAVDAGIAVSGAGKVRLLKPTELPPDWDPLTDPRLTAWEMVHHLIRVLAIGGDSAAAVLVAKLGSKAEVARELCYRLYTICERTKRTQEAISYNGLVQAWPEIERLAREGGTARAATPRQASFDEAE